MSKLTQRVVELGRSAKLSLTDVLKNRIRRPLLNPASYVLLQALAIQFALRPSLKRYLRGVDGWINFSIGFKTESGTVRQSISFENGTVKVAASIPENADAVLIFRDDDALVELFQSPPNEALNLVLKNRIVPEGNLVYLQTFNFYVSLSLRKAKGKAMNARPLKKPKQAQHKAEGANAQEYGGGAMNLAKEHQARLQTRMTYPLNKTQREPGVNYLADPYLAEFSISDFPRLQSFLQAHLNTKAEVCAERAKLLTDYFREHGFETDREGNQWVPELRQAQAFNYLMSHKRAIIRDDDLLAGTTSSNPIAGSVVYPDAQGLMIWGELLSIDQRSLMPFSITQDTIETLHFEVFPFWAKRNFKEWLRAKKGASVAQQINERWVAYFVWKTIGISHTVPNFKLLLEHGTLGIIDQIEQRIRAEELPVSGRHALEAMKWCLEGVNVYAQNLSQEAQRQAINHDEHSPRHQELERLALICKKVPMRAPDSLDEALNALWILWVSLHNENADTGLSFGRLDQLLQPYFASDMSKLKTKAKREIYLTHVIDLIGCFFMRCTDHFPLGPDIANFLFGGASSTQALTLGGITPEGDDAVNDMTYILLKVTEMLAIRDVNVNARYHPAKNSGAYLRRLCEVNLMTAGTPSMHNDEAVFASLKPHGYPEHHIYDWSATGCVEPSISGKHMGHTGAILMNLVAGLEMALNDGYHPLMNWQLGPRTGRVDEFQSFDRFFDAYLAQQRFLIDQAVELNNALAEIHAEYRPTPLLSALMDGAIQQAKDVTRGGALYNSSGVSNIGLADVTDSLLALKQLIFDQQRLSFGELKQALDSNFDRHPALRAMVQNKVPLFGSGSADAVAMANRVAGALHDYYHSCRNFRNGPYTAGFWSMSQHVAYGSLSGALPSGRKAGKAFTPGLTPQPSASKNFLDNICDVAGLKPQFMDNNMAFNVKLLPDPRDSREQTVHTMSAYVKSYFGQGGMQLQFNVVSSETLRDAMAHPENYRHLLVRISGYNAYFVTLNKELQMELIERAEYSL